VGPLTISVAGIEFNYANSNIIGPGVLLGSNPTTTGALVALSETTGHIGDDVYIWGYQYNQASGCTTTPSSCVTGYVTPSFSFGDVKSSIGSWSVITSTLTAISKGVVIPEDKNGAFEAEFVVPALPFTTPECVAGTASCYTLIDGSTFPGETSTTKNLAPDQSFTIQPEATFGPEAITSTTAVDNSFGYNQTVVMNGVASTDSEVTVTMNGVAWATCPSSTCALLAYSYNHVKTTWAGANGTEVVANLTAIGHTPSIEFPGGTYTVNASGTTSGNWAVTTNTLTVEPIQAESGCVATPGCAFTPKISALSVNSGNAGTSVALLSATTGGLHGLAANTAYTVMWDGTDQVSSFTSTASGEVPIGVSFTVPAGVSGFHIVDIQAKGVSALYGNQLTSGGQWGAVVETTPTVVTEDLLFYLIPVLTATPSLVGAGQTATVQGSGLPTSTLLYIVGPNSISYASFTSTATGGVPSGVTFTVPPQPTYGSAGAGTKGGELGTLETWNVMNSAGSTVGELQYVYGATASLSASSGAAGTSVTLTANGLNAPLGTAGVTSSNAPYSVVFNCVPSTLVADSCSGVGTGATPANIIVGALIPNGLGAASTTITIPTSATAGTYVIQLVGASETWDLAIPLTFTVGAPSGIGVTTLTPGSPSQSTLNGQPDITLTYTNTLSTSSITIVGYAVVSNALGQVVLYTTASATLAASGSQTLYFVLAGLPAGSYTVSIYAISSTGLVVSTTTSATAVIS
jgi:hypothetical protein